MMRQFDGNILVRAMVVFTLLVIISYFLAFALDEGNHLSTIEKAGAYLFYVLRFPTALLLYFFDGLPGFVLILGVAVNSAFYALLTERVIYLLFRKRKLG